MLSFYNFTVAGEFRNAFLQCYNKILGYTGNYQVLVYMLVINKISIHVFR